LGFFLQLKRVVLLRDERLEKETMQQKEKDEQKEKRAAELLAKGTAARDARVVKLDTWLAQLIAQDPDSPFANCNQLNLWLEHSMPNTSNGLGTCLSLKSDVAAGQNSSKRK
jgi:hypothetical protein